MLHNLREKGICPFSPQHTIKFFFLVITYNKVTHILYHKIKYCRGPIKLINIINFDFDFRPKRVV